MKDPHVTRAADPNVTSIREAISHAMLLGWKTNATIAAFIDKTYRHRGWQRSSVNGALASMARPQLLRRVKRGLYSNRVG